MVFREFLHGKGVVCAEVSVRNIILMQIKTAALFGRL